MAIRDIVPHTDSFIRKISRPVDKFDEKLWDLLDDMQETLQKEKGVGLAAVQIGVLKRVFIININNMNIEFINPKIESTSGKQVNEEACLSVKNRAGYVERPTTVTISAYDRYGNQFTLTCHEWTAICVCHEFDHLDGILFIDKLIKR